MSIEQKIMQAEAALSYKQLLFKNNRCKESDVNFALDIVNNLRLEQQGDFAPVQEVPVKKWTNVDRLARLLASGTGKLDESYDKSDVNSVIEKANNYDELQAGFSAEAKKLKDKQGEMSNLIVEQYKSGANGADGLMSQAIKLRKGIEEIWDKKKFLEKNGCLPQEEANLVDVEVSNELQEKRMAWQYERKLVKDQIYKLAKKIKDPTKHVNFNKVEFKMIDWRKEMLILEAKLVDFNLKIEGSV